MLKNIASWLLTTALISGCAFDTVDSGPSTESASAHPTVIPFQGMVNAATGELSFSSVGGKLTQGLSAANVVRDGNPGSGPANSVELVSTFTGAGAGACGVPGSLCWDVDLESFYGADLTNVFVEFDSMTPDTGFRGLNSVAAQMGLSDTYGLWSYGTVPPNTPSSQLWVLGDNGGSGTFTFHGNVMGDIPCNVLVISDTEAAHNAVLKSALEAQGLVVTMIEGLATYEGTPAAGNFGAVLIAVGYDFEVEIPQAGQDSILAAAQSGTGVVTTAWFNYLITNGQNATLANYSLYPYDSGALGENLLSFTLTSPGHPIWAGLPGTFTMTGSSAWNVAAATINGGVAIASSPQADIGVAVREDMASAGRVVNLAHAANFGSEDIWTAGPEISLLTGNSIKWACQ